MIGLLILILLVGLVLGLALWAIDLLPIISAPFKQFAKVICIIIAILIIIGAALPLTGLHTGLGICS